METLEEWSAGGIVLRRAEPHRIQVLLIQHSMHNGWSFPKGWVEPGETPQEAAVREVEEESGVLGQIIADLPPTRYFFVNHEGKRIAKTVTWYLMRYLGEGNQTHAFEVSAVEWLPLEGVHTRLTYKNDKELFSVALAEIVRAAL
ncbi:MAG TPA: NUDIX domain-containing protein [Candidatus Kapabacteria bacterium]|nr:NUDIX domain-containing protein [Candidatus Kapabacteria bacterium]